MSRFVLTAQLQLQAPNNVAQVVSQIQSQLNNINVQVNVQGSARATQQIQQITQSTNAASTAAERMGRTFAVSIRRFAAFSIATRAVGLFTSTLSNAIQTAIDFERQLIKVAQVTGKDISSLRDLTNEITNLSTNMGVSSQSLLEVTTILTQAGLSADETKVALNSLAKAALAPNFDSITQTAEGAIAILAQFKQGVGALEGQLGSINAVAGAFAVEASDLIDVIRRTGGVFKSSGGDLNELLALFTSVRATTRESAESIGTGLRTIFTRIQRPATIDFLKQFGVTLVDLEGKFVGPYEAVRRLSEALAGLGERDITFIKIAEELGGFRQIGKVLPLLQQFATAEAALNVATQANNSLSKDAITAQASLAIRIMKVKEEFLSLIRAVTETPTFQIMANTALTLASALIKVADSIKPLLPLLTAVAAFKAIKGIGGFLGGITGGMRSGRTYHDGGKVHRFATGGLVPGVGNSDTVPAMLSPGEFVIRKSSVQKLGASNLAHMNNGGKVQKYAIGGEVSVGAAVLKGRKSTQSSNISYNDIISSVKKPEVRDRISQTIPVGKNYNLIKDPLSKEDFKYFDDAINQGLVSSVNAANKVLSKVLNVPAPAVPKNQIENFTRGLNDAARGNLFETILTSMLNMGKWDSNPDPQRPFDFIGGIGLKSPSGRLLFPDISGLNYVDAKASMEAASKDSMAKKIANQLYIESKGIEFSRKKKLTKGELVSSLADKYKGNDDRLSQLSDRDRELVRTTINSGKIPSRAGATSTIKRLLSNFATGGGVGTDTVPALLTPGEFVINRKSAERIGYGNLNTMNKFGRYANGGVVQRFGKGGKSDIQKGIQSGDVGIFDSDKITGGTNIKNAILQTLMSSGKPYSVISGPAGSGKTTFASQRFGQNFILSPDDLPKYNKFVVLSGASKTKSGTFSPDADRLFSGSKDITVLSPSEERLTKQRQGRVDLATASGSPDQRSIGALQGTLKAPTSANLDLFTKYKNVKILTEYATGGEIQKFAVGGLSSKKVAISSSPTPMLQEIINRIAKNPKGKEYQFKSYQQDLASVLNNAYKGILMPGLAPVKDKITKDSIVSMYDDYTGRYVDVTIKALEEDLKYVTGGNIRKGSLKKRKGVGVGDMLDTIRAYQGLGLDYTLNAALASGTTNQTLGEFSGEDLPEVYKAAGVDKLKLSELVKRMDAAAQYKFPKKLYSGLGDSKLDLILRQTNTRQKKDVLTLPNKMFTMPSFLSASDTESIASSFARVGMLTILTNPKKKGIIPQTSKETTINRESQAERSKKSRVLQAATGGQGFNGIPIDEHYTDAYDSEGEYIFPSNSKFKILSIDKSSLRLFDKKAGYRHINMLIQQLNKGGLIKKFATGGEVQHFLDGGWVQRMKKQPKSVLQKHLTGLKSSMLFAGSGGAYIHTYETSGSGSYDYKELVDTKELQERYNAILEFVTGGKRKPKDSGLRSAGGYSSNELLDAVTLYQGGSGPLTRAMVNNDLLFVDRNEQYDTEDITNRLKAATQHKLPKKLYSGLGRGQYNEIIRDVGLKSKSQDLAKSKAKLIGKVIDFPTFLSTSIKESVARSFVGSPGAMMSIDTSKSKEVNKGLDILKAKQTKMEVGAKSDRRLPGINKINIGKLANYDEEKEIVLPPYAKFKINAASSSGKSLSPLYLKTQMFKTGGGVGTDTVPALLTPGEFVVNRKSAERIGYGNLNTMNKFGRYANGGVVQKFSAGTTGPTGVKASSSGTPSLTPTQTQSVPTASSQVNGTIIDKLIQEEANIIQQTNKVILDRKKSLEQEFKTELDQLRSTTHDQLANAKQSEQSDEAINDLKKEYEKNVENLVANYQNQYKSEKTSLEDPQSIRSKAVVAVLAQEEANIRKQINITILDRKASLQEEFKKELSQLRTTQAEEIKYAQESGKTAKQIDDLQKLHKKNIENLVKNYQDQFKSEKTALQNPQEIQSKAMTAVSQGLNPHSNKDKEDIKILAEARAKQGLSLDYSTDLGKKTQAVTTARERVELEKMAASARKAAAANLEEAAASDKASKADASEASNSSKTSSQAGNLGLGLSLVSGTLSSMLPVLDENSSLLTKMGHGILNMATMLGGVIFALEAMGVSLKLNTVMSFLLGRSGDAATASLINFTASLSAGAAAMGLDGPATLLEKIKVPLGNFGGYLVKLAGPILLAVGAIYLLKSAADNLFEYIYGWEKTKKAAIQAGDITGAGNAAEAGARYSTMSSGIATGAVTGAATGAVIGSIFPVLGTAMGALVGALTGGFVSAISSGFLAGQLSDEARQTAMAFAANTKASKDLEAAQTDASIAAEKFKNGTISASEYLEVFKDSASSVAEAQFRASRVAEQAISGQSTGLSAAGRNIGAYLGGGLFGMETAGTRNKRLTQEAADVTQANAADMEKLFTSSAEARSAVIKSVFAGGGTRAEAEAAVKEKSGISIADMTEQKNALEMQAKAAREAGNFELAAKLDSAVTQAAARIRLYNASLENLEKESAKATAAFKAMNLGLRGPEATATALSASLTRFAAGLEVGGNTFVANAEFLSQSMSSAAQAIDSVQFEDALKGVSGELVKLGLSATDATKFEENTRGFFEVQKNYTKTFEEVRKKLQADAKAGRGGTSADDIKKAFADELTAGINNDVLKNRIKDVINNINLSEGEINDILLGNVSIFGEKLGEADKKQIQEIVKISQERQKAEQVVIGLIKQRADAERNFAQVQKEALDLLLEGREIQAKYGGKVVTQEERKTAIIGKSNVGIANAGLEKLTTGSLEELRKRNTLILAGFKGIEDKRSKQGGLSIAQGVKLDEQQKNLQQAQKDQVNTIKELIKLEEENLRLIGEKNKLEKESIDALVSGDIDKFLQTQATIGATAAISTGNQALMRAFGPEALGSAAQDIRRQQEAGVQSLFGRQLAGQGGLTQTAFGAALGARGITDPRFAQMASATTAEEEAAKSRLRDLGTALGETGTTGMKMAEMQVETAKLNVNNAEIMVNDITKQGVAAAAVTKANGGLIYANRGMFIPRGTDTVPAMLTPGEFVVRREAVNRGNNLQILQQMNGTGGGISDNSAVMGFARGGKVQYYAGGGVSSNGGSGSAESFEKLTQALNKVMGYVNGVAESIKSLPTTISHQIADTRVDVNVNSGMLAAFSDNLESKLMNKVADKIKNSYPTENGMRDGTVLGSLGQA